MSRHSCDATFAMSSRRTRVWLSLSTILAIPTAVAALGFDCGDILVKGETFNLKPLGGVKTVHEQIVTPPTIHNTTFALDICKELKWNSDVDASEQCERGARVCGQREVWEKGELKLTDEVINIAGQFDNRETLEARPELLGHGSSHKDAKSEGVRIIFNGGRYPFNRKGQKQQAIIEFICNRTVTGNERYEDADLDGKLRRNAEDNDDEDEGGDQEPGDDLTHPDAGKSLQFVSYEMEDDLMVLRITWHTQYACLGEADNPSDSPAKSGSGWGFFTWSIIM